MDLQGGILHAEERDYKTAYSYFFESFESFSNLEDSRALSGLKYMLLTKIMTNHVRFLEFHIHVLQTEDMDTIIAGKGAIKFAGRDIEAMRAVAKAHSHRALEEFEQAKAKYPDGKISSNSHP
jgi:26S proteasome regulatory subunit N6